MKKLTIKTFFLMLSLFLLIHAFSYSCIWIFLPYSDKIRGQNELNEQAGELVSELRKTSKYDSDMLFNDFIWKTGAELCLLNRFGNRISFSDFRETEADIFEGSKYPFRFADSDEEYILLVRQNPSRSREITDAILRSIPCVALVTIVLSLAGAYIFSRYTTRPIQRISKIADSMAKLDFSWYCPDVRDDEIGTLSKSINTLSDKLHDALDELYLRNAALEDEITREKERERRKMLFFSGVSHELKTPIAIVIGQLEGMQAQIGIYKDREKYLAKSAEILQSLNQFIREVLMVSHIDMEMSKAADAVNLSELLDALFRDYSSYAEDIPLAFYKEIEEDIWIYADEPLLKKAIGNVFGNAAVYSGEHGRVTVKLSENNGKALLEITNTPAHIEEHHLPHLFEAFYRGEQSAGNGSGLGLYITKMILEIYHVPHQIENTSDGVRFTALFQKAPD